MEPAPARHGAALVEKKEGDMAATDEAVRDEPTAETVPECCAPGRAAFLIPPPAEAKR